MLYKAVLGIRLISLTIFESTDFQGVIKKKKRKLHLKLPLVVILCGGRDSNSHRLTPTTPSK